MDVSFEPTVAERTRSVVAAAASLTMTTDTDSQALAGRHSLDRAGEVVLHLPADCETAETITCSGDTSVPTVLEFTDVAPTAVRSRVRARLTLAGALSARPDRGCECVVGVLAPELITLDTLDSVLVVHPGAFAAAETDPLAAYEADLLVHLADAHADLVEGLTRLIPSATLEQAARVLPSAMDRYGITLRLERAQGHTDVRLPFPSRLDDASAAGEYVRAMATGTPLCPHRLQAP
ncbi:DUF2470 domain-containing protein [Actinopolymorpha pittospori]|uniref:DUF2470 domain-containing protein n=1 Tax=Actinopolymorpha pittospori TaxID=648752 RepID=A0A927MR35_9ACTN|nr:DUF2470 domain-containing protein [Actinopolymorpha pittospori]MBE1604687.1 hypothetical protein [Actinopolymorpha pittospori]